MRLPLLLSLVFLLALSVASQVDEGEGLIRGTVLTDDGKPVADAHVDAEVMQGSNILTVLNANTDDYGIFLLSRLHVGEYRVSAEKQEAGYLSTRPDIFGSRPPQTILLTPDAPSASVVIHFAPKAGVITGWVRDSVTGRSIPAHLSLAPMSGEGGWSTTGTNPKFKFQLQIPADTAVRFGACSEGYKPWFYADSSAPSSAAPLKLSAGAELEIEIKLERNIAKTPCFYGKF